jgi:integrase
MAALDDRHVVEGAGPMSRALSAGRLYRKRFGEGVQRWCLDFRDADGKRKRRALSTDKSVAERMRVELIRARDMQLAGLASEAGQSRPIEEVRAAFLADLSVRATSEHVRNVRAHLTHFFEDVRVQRVRDLQPHMVLAHRARQIAAGSSRETMNHRVRSLKAMFGWAVSCGMIAANPIANVKTLPVGERYSRRTRRALSDVEIDRVLEAAVEDDRRMQARLARSPALGGESKGARWEARRERIPQAPFFRTLAQTGCRYGELVRAKWDDLDFSARTLTLRAANTKTGRTRVLPLRSSLVFELMALKATHERVLGSAGPRVFVSPEGVEWSSVSRNALRVFHRILERAGIARRDANGHVVDLHALRHSYASQLARNGVSLAHAQRLLGHADVSMTAKVYTHLGVEDLRAAVESIGTNTTARDAVSSA